MLTTYKILQRFLVGALSIAYMANWSLAAEEDSLYSDSEEEKHSPKKTERIRPQSWEERAKAAASSWEESLEQLKKEAEIFLQEYRKKYPDEPCPTSIEGLIVLNKPNIVGLQKEVEEFNRKQGEGQPKTKWENHLRDPNRKFLIPVL